MTFGMLNVVDGLVWVMFIEVRDQAKVHLPKVWRCVPCRSGHNAEIGLNVLIALAVDFNKD